LFALGDRSQVVFDFVVGNGLIVEIDLIGDVETPTRSTSVAVFRPEATQPATIDDDMAPV
jgi:hypothetical protein